MILKPLPDRQFSLSAALGLKADQSREGFVVFRLIFDGIKALKTGLNLGDLTTEGYLTKACKDRLDVAL